MRHAKIAGAVITLLMSGSVAADDAAWKAKKIADALTAAPPAVTKDAQLWAWKSTGEFVKLRDGNGPYKCVASGSFAERHGKPALPFPDPMCMDANSWAFLSAVWKEKNPMKPSKAYPTAPGMVWMLAGMQAPGGRVRHADNPEAQYQVVKGTDKKMVRLSPHIMVMPLPMNGKQSLLGYQYDTKDPNASWVMAADTPLEHLMMHFTEKEAAEMMQAGK